jgi:hypothetical protein
MCLFQATVGGFWGDNLGLAILVDAGERIKHPATATYKSDLACGAFALKRAERNSQHFGCLTFRELSTSIFHPPLPASFKYRDGDGEHACQQKRPRQLTASIATLLDLESV